MSQFYRAFLICIQTVEHSDPSLLMNIDPKLVNQKKRERENQSYSIKNLIHLTLVYHGISNNKQWHRSINSTIIE
jgi:hypothetical protein